MRARHSCIVVFNLVNWFAFDLQKNIAYFHLAMPGRRLCVDKNHHHAWTIEHRPQTATKIGSILFSISESNLRPLKL